MFLVYIFALAIVASIIGMKLHESDRIWRWWIVGCLIRSDDRRHATEPRLHHLKYMR